MRKVIKLALLALFLTSINYTAFAAAGDWTFSATNWLRYGLVNQDKQGTLKDQTITTEASLQAARGYVRYAYQFTDTIKGQWTVDFFSAKTTDFKDGIGIKFKESYVALPFFLPETSLTIGLQKNYVGLLYDYDYRIIEKEFIDKNSVDASADYGVTINGYLPNGFGTYNIGVYNGEGYKKALASEANIEPAGIVEARLIPIPGITVGGSYKTHLQGVNTTLAKNVLSTIVARTAYGPFDMWAEYVDQKITSQGTPTQAETQKNGYSVMPSYTINPQWTILARYDRWDSNTNVDQDKVNTTIGGINYAISKGVVLQLNYQVDKPEDRTKATKTSYLTQLTWNFSKVFVQ